MSIPVSITKVVSTTSDRGLKELSVPGDPTGFTGTAGIHYARTFVGTMYLAGIPQATAAALKGADYLSLIHGGLGSDPSNQFANVGGVLDVPAFPNPEVTGYYNSGPNAADQQANGFKNTEKSRRTNDAAVAGDATTWSIVDGRRRLTFSLFLRSGTNPGSDFFMIEVYRDLNNSDKGAGTWGGLTTDVTNAQLVYQYGPFLSKPNTTNRHANAQIMAPVDLPAGCNLYIIARNITTPASTNFIAGSIRLVT